MTELERRVLAVMPSSKDAQRTTELLASHGVPCLSCSDLPTACAEMQRGVGALLVAEEMLRRERSRCLQDALEAQPAWSVVPVIVLGRGEPEARVEPLLSDSKAQVSLVERPVRTRTLVSVVKAALRARAHQHDIRLAMLERERQAALLRDREERLAFALTAGRLGDWELDLEGGVLTSSALCKATFGRKPEDPFTYEDLQQAIHPDDRARVRQAIQTTIERLVDYDVEYRTVWPNGEVHWVLVRGRAVIGADANAKHLIGVSLDVTDKKRAEEALTDQAEQLRDAGRRKDEFLATLAHELRNPLAPVRTGLAVLAGTPPEAAARRTREMMERQLAHMVRLIDDLLDVSRITRGKVVLKREMVSLRSVVDMAVEANRPLLDGAHHRLSITLPHEELIFDADPTRLAQIIGNLLNNAAKYTPGSGDIRLVARREGEQAVIEVQDNGLGIPSDKLDDVFEMFNQVNRTLDRSQGGLGIGLALVRELVALHGGTIQATSAGLGHGSIFTIWLPLVTRATDVLPASTSTQEQTARRVLVVDDNEDAAQTLALFLEMSGHTTCTAHSGSAALNAVAQFQPEVVFLDIGLPGMDGYEVARRLRDDPGARRTTLVALTGWGTEEDKTRAFQAGFDYHLTKPVEITAIDHLFAGLPSTAP